MYFNPELSWLAFNQRVLEEALDKTNPLLERLKFLTIVSSNLDEFFEVKVAKLKERLADSDYGQEFQKQLAVLSEIRSLTDKMLESQYHCLNKEILPELREYGIRLLDKKELTQPQFRWAKKYFKTEILPVLTPLAIDPSHPFPQLLNKSLNFIVEIKGEDSFGRNIDFAIVQAPRILPRLISLPARKKGNHEFILLTNLIQLFISDLFEGVKVEGVYSFRLTRNSDLDIDEDESDNLLKSIEQGLKKRHYGDVVRLEVTTDCPDKVAHFLQQQFVVKEHDTYRVNGPVNLSRLASLLDALDHPELRYPPYSGYIPDELKNSPSLFQSIEEGDIMLHHPFDSFEPIQNLLEEAAGDPKVLAIKQTLYRTGDNSPIVQSLIKAARNGKQVSVIMELKARFDEENNINAARLMEEAGIHVVYGIVGLKTHAKMCLIARKDGQDKIKYFAHVGTGNYNHVTSRFYTDISLLTARRALCHDIADTFSMLTGVSRYKEMDKLVLAPFTLHRTMMEKINREIHHAKKGKPARIIAKMNALLEHSLIEKLYEASQAGVEIILIVRGMCSLIPGVKKVSENITVLSIVDRYLEHSRIIYFLNNGEPAVYISSADWMPRNMFKRVEICAEIEDPKIKDRIINEILEAYRKDTVKARYLTKEGTYQRPKSQNPFHAQLYLMEHHPTTSATQQ